MKIVVDTENGSFLFILLMLTNLNTGSRMTDYVVFLHQHVYMKHSTANYEHYKKGMHGGLSVKMNIIKNICFYIIQGG